MNRYEPIENGYRILLDEEAEGGRVSASEAIGAATGDPRLHKRALYPLQDKAALWNEVECEKIRDIGFRPIVIAYNTPRFLFDYHYAGGILGQLFLAVTDGRGGGTWIHDWRRIDLSCIEGRIEYRLSDPSFPGAALRIVAIALANLPGLCLRIEASGLRKGAGFLWVCGGATGIFDNHVLEEEAYRFRPTHCADNEVAIEDGRFRLTKVFDESSPDYAPMKILKKLGTLRVSISGACSRKGPMWIADPGQALDLPGLLSNPPVPSEGNPLRMRSDGVAVGSVDFAGPEDVFYLVVGSGFALAETCGNPERHFEEALRRNASIAGRVVIHTPDPYLDAAVPMISLASEATWACETFVHGGWSWRSEYLGWRTWYGPACYGWLDRIRTAIRNHIRICRIRSGEDEGALKPNFHYGDCVCYNMNEVFLDQVRQYLDYTDDRELLEEILPVLEGILAWENRRLRPIADEPLYENAFNTWISDSHHYTRAQCTQASAYMYRAHSMMADCAKRLGRDPEPYRKQAEAIRAAMNGKLWLEREGIFAESLDTKGHGLLHAQPELATIYHPIEFGVADEVQTLRMLRWVEENLRSEQTPNGGRLFWSSNWHPNKGGHNTHSTYILAYGEELNLALAECVAGRAEEAYRLIQGSLCGIYNGKSPGSLSCQNNEDGTQLRNEDFADSTSMFGRAVVEGLFGIVPKRMEGTVRLSPVLPSAWKTASIRTPLFSYSFHRGADCILLDWESFLPEAVALELRIPLQSARAVSVRIDGQDGRFENETSAGTTWISLRTPGTARKGSIAIALEGVADSPASEDRPGTPPHPLVPPSSDVYTVPSEALDVGPDRLHHWHRVDLAASFTADSPAQVLQRFAASARPPDPPASAECFEDWRNHLLRRCLDQPNPPCDDAWRGKTDPETGIAWTSDGIPFRSAKTGPNLAVVTLAGGYPEKVAFPVGQSGRTLYLLLTGMTFPSQSHVVNVRVTLSYEDGVSDVVDLVNPTGIGDCWGTWLGRYHQTLRNGFENLAGRYGPSGSHAAGDLSRPVAVDTEAHLVPFVLRAGVVLQRVSVEAICNDAVFAVMGATILR